MNTNKIIKITGLNVSIAVLNVILFSEGLLHIKIGGENVLASTIGVTSILMSLLVFVYGNFKLLTQKKERLKEREINTPEECVYALRQYKEMRTFSREIVVILEQTQRFFRKKETIKEILLQKFNSGEMSYNKFQGTVDGIEDVFYRNIKSILNKLSAFDEVDYNQIRTQTARNGLSQEFIDTKMEIYNQYILFVKESMEDNEQILLKLDRLLLELSRFNSLEDGEIENMSAMKEIDDLISKTKLYK